ncbi:MAG: hypothetical protein IPM35_20920 [Myxococcales bacterium]|nr:hypothetical protein [Myxococcales bacterium]
MSEPTALAHARAPSFERALVLSALLYSACRFVPLPFADDIFRNAVARLIVSQALDRHGRTFSSKEVAALYSEPVGCLAGCLTALPKLLAKLILFPIRKLLAWIGAVRGISRDLVTALLFGRSVERCLVRGLLPEGGTGLGGQAKLIRGAFDRALGESQLSISKSALAAVVRQSKRGLGAAGRAVAAMFQKRADAGQGELPEADRAAVNEGAERVEHALESPGVLQEIAAFDARFDQELERVGLGEPVQPEAT